MSLIFQPSSIFAGRANGWLREGASGKILAAFVAGAVLAVVASKLPAISTKAGDTPPSTATTPAAEKRTEPARAEKREIVARERKIAAKRAEPDAAAKPSAREPAATTLTVAPQGLPQVRVIAPGRITPPSTALAAPTNAPPAEATANSTDSNVGAAPRDPEPPVAAATPAAQETPTVVADSTSSQSAAKALPAIVPMPPVRPQLAVSEPPVSEPQLAASPTESSPAPSQIAGVRKEKPAKETRKHVRREVPPEGREARGEAALRDGEWTRDGRRETRRTQADSSRPRAQSVHAQNEADGFQLVRTRTLPDGRRVTVYRRYDDGGRVMAYGDDRPSRRSFFGLFDID